MHKTINYLLFFSIFSSQILMHSCANISKKETPGNEFKLIAREVIIEAEDFTKASEEYEIIESDSSLSYVYCANGGWLAFDVNIKIPGRYKTSIRVSAADDEVGYFWMEDYYDNKDDRTYNISGTYIHKGSSEEFAILHKDGSPLDSGVHKMKFHFSNNVRVDWVKFNLMREHETTPLTLKQNTNGKDWVVVWSDEFNTQEIDTTKWTYDIGNWGWGNGELQYYTSNRKQNARIENDNLIIEARRNDMGQEWTSARLTTRGKVSFTYGKIEFRAKVPQYKGNWAAGWTLGDDYVDEISWPYCGEIDILESVGYEMNDTTGTGIAHASVHCGAYYFKLGNQPTGVIEVENMNTEYHTYAVEWLPDKISTYVDDKLYASYNDTSTDLSWPFSKPQNIILNLAMGGGWGGELGIADVDSQIMIIDYVRVYELK
ncbi:MAG: hypothetical protein C0598_01150 [Marinilabiliales bacterium]|nr:MAG: hypothetical protein C0598_01150 [Marinilabiliales bacterium]